MRKSVCLLLGENPRGNISLKRCTMCPQYVQRLTNHIRIDFGLSVNANTAAVAANDPRRLKSALSAQWTVAQPTWVTLPSTWLNRRWRWQQWLALCLHGPHKFSEWLTGKLAPSSLHFGEIRPTHLTDSKCIDKNRVHHFRRVIETAAHLQVLCHFFVKESPKWDIKPFCTPCTQIQNKILSGSGGVDSKTSWKMQKTSECIRELEAHVNPHNKIQFLIPRLSTILASRSSNMDCWFCLAFIHQIKHVTKHHIAVDQ